MSKVSKIWLSDDVIAQLTGTGIVNGGIITINTNTAKFDISAGRGYVLDNYTDPLTPSVTYVVWDAFTAAVDYYITSPVTNIAIDKNGNIYQKSEVGYTIVDKFGGVVGTPVVFPPGASGSFTLEESRELIILGKTIHDTGSPRTFIVAVTVNPRFINNLPTDSYDLSHALGVINISGNIYTYSGSNLSLNKSEGILHRVGINYVTSRQNPNTYTVSNQVMLTFKYRYQDDIILYPNKFKDTAPGTEIDPDYYDDGTGTLALVPVGKYTVQRIFLFKNYTVITYGQTVYDTIQEAKDGISTERPHLDTNLEDAALRCSLLLKQGVTNLNNADVFFSHASKLGEAVLSTGATGSTGSSGYSGTYGASGYSGISGFSGYSGPSGFSGYSGHSGKSGYSGVGDKYTTSSSTYLTIATGSQYLTVGIGLALAVGQTLIIANDTTHKMEGDITSYNPSNGDLYVNVATITGTGSFSSWSVSLNGAPGATGPQGTSGYSGTGTSGYSGFIGITGTSGYSGLGVSGYSGSIGTSGYSGLGISGYSGSIGTSGFSGYSGSGFSGYSGQSGYSGLGYSGYSGRSGYSGLGYSGYSGRSGYSGIGSSGFSGYSGVGSSGFSGYSGEGGSGYSGALGVSGYSGAGISGYSGMPGAASSSGYSGYSGRSGYSGKSGYSGSDGTNGDSGFSGYSGVDGVVGSNGQSGYSGRSGYSGASGYSGISGPAGAPGTPGSPGSTGQSGWSGYSGSGVSGYSGAGQSGFSGYSGVSGYSGRSGYSGYSGRSGYSGVLGTSGFSGYSGTINVVYGTGSPPSAAGYPDGTVYFQYVP